MFKIIGADQKEYGPVATAQIRQWIIDGRLTGQTQAQREGSTEWQPLSAFEEFADVLRPAAPSPAAPAPMGAPAPMAAAAPTGSREAAFSAVKGPAIALIITSAIAMGLYLIRGLMLLFVGGAMLQQNLPPDIPPAVRSMLQMRGPAAALVCLMIVAINALILFGAIKMSRLQNHTLAIIACIVAMLPCGCCCVLGLPFGIWGLIVLNKPEVKSHFQP